MSKSVETRRNYEYRLIEDPEGFFYIEIPELPGCSATGKTLEEALKNVKKAQREWIKFAKKHGRPIPSPEKEREYSGRFVLRIDKKLHEELSKQAKEEDISLNQHIYRLILAGQKNVENELMMRTMEELASSCRDAISFANAQTKSVERLAGQLFAGALVIDLPEVEEPQTADVVAFRTNLGTG
jgi:predicted RNase H-like HicB family nuclease